MEIRFKIGEIVRDKRDNTKYKIRGYTIYCDEKESWVEYSCEVLDTRKLLYYPILKSVKENDLRRDLTDVEYIRVNMNPEEENKFLNKFMNNLYSGEYTIGFDPIVDPTNTRRKYAHILTPKLKKVFVNKKKKTLVIEWETGEKTKVTCQEGDKFDLEKGMAMAITKYVLGNNFNAYSILEKYMNSVIYQGDNK